VAKQYVLNQSKGFWLLLDALACGFTLCILMISKDSKIQNLNQPLKVVKVQIEHEHTSDQHINTIFGNF
jgi:hypothetical protein